MQKTEEEMSSVKTFKAGLDFIEKYNSSDNWFLSIESFDPHEPFYVPQKYRDMYNLSKEIDINWPAYMPVDDDLDLISLRKEYASLVTMCDYYLGKVLDIMDKYDMWKDTMLIVNTDHGFLLGEHNYLGKNFWPMHQEVIHTPFYIHVPNCNIGRRKALCQTIDIAPTLLDYFNLPIPENMEGKSLLPIVKDDKNIHDYILFGVNGGHVNIKDGQYVYMKSSKDETNEPYVECTLMPTNMRSFFKGDDLKNAEFVEGDKFSNYIPYLKVKTKTFMKPYIFGDLLFDIKNGEQLIEDKNIENKMKEEMVKIMKYIEVPKEEFERLGLTQ